ncbi:MAG: pilus assembly protein TadG-related protein [Pseudomonadota bacterium]
MSDRLTSLKNSTRIFHREEDGSFVIFALFIFIVMIMIGGLAIDVMRYENLRTTMQNSVDRAVLAAADLDQTVDPEAVVADYLDKAGMKELPYEVDVFESKVGTVVTGRKVTVNASADLGTYFMKMMGTPTISAPANSTAEEAVNEIEISMILDVSGSMGWGTKLDNMQNASKTFVTEVLDGVEPGQVSINVVPYSTQVNAGATLLGQFSHTNDHNYSHCVDFEQNDFNTTVLSPTVTLQQAGHFDPWSGYWRGTFETMAANGDTPSWVCRTESDFEITPWASSETAIHNQIDGFTARGNTSIDVAVKWGSALLDPSTRSVFTNLRATPAVSNDFVGDRPYDYNNPAALKFMVVMTDGINTTQYQLDDAYRSGGSGVFKDPDTGRYSFEDEEINDYDGDSDWNEEYWYARNYGSSSGRYWIDNVYDSGANNAFELTWPQLWAEMSMSHRAYSHFYQRYYNADHYYDNYYRGSTAPREAVNAAQKDTRLNNICSAAKANGVIIFTIGFEVTDASAIVMQNCASTANHFYRVEGLEIEYAFESIANQINQLKLTQ